MTDPLDELAEYLRTFERERGHTVALRTDVARWLTALEGVRKDARRYAWLRERLDSADFEYGEPQRPILAFRWPDRAAISPDLDSSIDAAIQEL